MTDHSSRELAESTEAPAPPLFQVTDECKELGLRAGAILIEELQVEPANEELRTLIDLAVEKTRAELPEMGMAKNTPELKQIDEIFRACGVKPRKHSSSVHRLYHSAIKRNTFPAINNLVDAYNLVSLETRCTLGAHDIDRFTAPCTLKLTTGMEQFIPLGQADTAEVAPNEFSYIDGDNRMMCRLNILQGDFSKVTESTKQAMVIIEGSVAHSESDLTSAVDRCLELIERFCGCRGQVICPITES